MDAASQDNGRTTVTWDAAFRICTAVAVDASGRPVITVTFDHVEPVLDAVIRLRIEAAAAAAAAMVLRAE